MHFEFGNVNAEEPLFICAYLRERKYAKDKDD